MQQNRKPALQPPAAEPSQGRQDVERRAERDEALRQAVLDRDRPVPDPEGHLITPEARDEAERKMLAEMRGPTRAQIRAPHPAKGDWAGREAAEQWVATGEALVVPQEPAPRDWWDVEDTPVLRGGEPAAVDAARSWTSPAEAEPSSELGRGSPRNWWDDADPAERQPRPAEPAPDSAPDWQPDPAPERRR